MNVAVHHAIADETPASYTVSGFFRDEGAVQSVMLDCLHRGVPRDLIDVAVSAAASKQFFGGRASTSRDSWFSWTGRGALAGLLLSAILTLLIVMLPGFNTSNTMAVVQLMGPDFGIIIGAAVGALYGWLKPGDLKPQMLRARERSDAVLMLVHLQPQAEAEAISTIFTEHGAESLQVDLDTARSVGAE